MIWRLLLILIVAWSLIGCADDQSIAPTNAPTVSANQATIPLNAWTNIAFSDQVVYKLAISPKSPTVMFTSLKTMLYRSVNEGRTWESLPLSIICPETVANIFIHQSHPNEIYTFSSASVDGTGCVYWGYSNDAGSTWKAQAVPEREYMGGILRPHTAKMFTHPQTDDWYRLFRTSFLSRSTEEMFARSTDSGESWQIETLPPAVKHTTNSSQHVYGFFWTEEGVALLGSSRDAYYLSPTAGAGYLYYRLDEREWQQLTTPEGIILKVVITPDMSDVYILVGSQLDNYDQLELYKMNEQLKFERVSLLPLSGLPVVLHVDPANQDRLFIYKRAHSEESSQTESIYFSINGGRIWQKLLLPRPLTIYDMVVQPANRDGISKLYLASNQGIWAYAYTSYLLPQE